MTVLVTGKVNELAIADANPSRVRLAYERFFALLDEFFTKHNSREGLLREAGSRRIRMPRKDMRWQSTRYFC